MDGELEGRYRAEVAFNILQLYNPLRNDLDAYLFDVAEWGKGCLPNAPNPWSFGIVSQEETHNQALNSDKVGRPCPVSPRLARGE